MSGITVHDEEHEYDRVHNSSGSSVITVAAIAAVVATVMLVL